MHSTLPISAEITHDRKDLAPADTQRLPIYSGKESARIPLTAGVPGVD